MNPARRFCENNGMTAHPPSPVGILVGLRLAFVLAYPVLFLVSHAQSLPWLRTLLLPVAVALVAGPALMRGSVIAWGVFTAAAGISAAILVWPELGLWPPVLVTGIMACWFGASLLPGREPVLLGFARAIHVQLQSPLPEQAPAWLAGWTGVWAGFMAASCVVLAGLALTHSLVAWTLATLAIPLLSGALVVLEWVLRRRTFPPDAAMSLPVFLRSVARVYGPRRAG